MVAGTPALGHVAPRAGRDTGDNWRHLRPPTPPHSATVGAVSTLYTIRGEWRQFPDIRRDGNLRRADELHRASTYTALRYRPVGESQHSGPGDHSPILRH